MNSVINNRHLQTSYFVYRDINIASLATEVRYLLKFVISSYMPVEYKTQRYFVF